jgi:hypothetical protein
MPATFIVDLKNSATLGVSIVPQTVATATATNGTGVDCLGMDGPVNALLTTGNCGDSTLTLNVKLQECDTSGGTYTDFVTATAFAELAGATLADNKAVLLTGKRTKRYVRVVATTAGAGTLSAPIAAVILGQSKINGTGAGTRTTETAT